METTRTTEIERWRFYRDVTVFNTTRHGGYSEGEYGEFNINPWVGDNPDHVAMNRQLLTRQLKLSDTSRLILPHQVHGTATLQITRDFFELKPEVQAEKLEGIDIVITDVPSVCIGVSTADCTPVILYDTKHHAAAAVHAGWRGMKARIVQKATRDMHSAYGSEPIDMRALIGPCIHNYNYQVGHDVWQQFHDAGFDMRQITMPCSSTSRNPIPLGRPDIQENLGCPEEQKYYLDICFGNMFQLIELGIKSRRIVHTMRNSYTGADKYFSARRQGINCGRTYTGIIL